MLTGALGWFGIDYNRKTANNYKRLRCGRSRRPRLEILEDRQMLATMWVSVNGDGDFDDNDGIITLREAIAYVNGDEFPAAGDLTLFETDAEGNLLEQFGVNDTILFDSYLDDDEHDTITFAQGAGELKIERPVKIDATALSRRITIDANLGSRVFNILLDEYASPDPNGKYNVTLAGLKIKRGQTSGNGSGIYYQGSYNYSTLSIID